MEEQNVFKTLSNILKRIQKKKRKKEAKRLYEAFVKHRDTI